MTEESLEYGRGFHAILPVSFWLQDSSCAILFVDPCYA